MIDLISSFIARKSASEKDSDQIRLMFKNMDINGDSRGSKDEVFGACEKLNILLTDNQIEDMFKKYDKNRTGTLEFSEFVAAFMNKQKLLHRECIEELFEFIDFDKNGIISLEDFKKLLDIKDTNLGDI